MVIREATIVFKAVDRLTSTIKNINKNMSGLHAASKKVNMPMEQITGTLGAMGYSFDRTAGSFNRYTGSVIRSMPHAAKLAHDTYPQFKSMADKMGISTRELYYKMDGLNMVMHKNGAIMNTVTDSTVKQGAALGAISTKHEAFQMHLLSTMFLGMQLQATMLGLLQPSMEAAGIFEAWGDMLEITFMPAIDSILEPFENLMDWISDLPEPIQNLIGSFVLVMGAIGGILFTFSQLALGLIGVKVLFGMLGMATGAIILKIMLVIGIITLIVYAILHWREILEGLGKVFDWVVEKVGSAFNKVDDIINDILSKIVSRILGTQVDVRYAVETIKKIIVGIFEELLDRAVNWGSDLVKKIASGIRSVGSSIANAFWNILPEPLAKLLKGTLFIAGTAISLTSPGFIGGLASRIPFLQEGGVVARPTLAMIGESGPEAVIPLSSMGKSGATNVYLSPTITIEKADLSSDIGIRETAERLGRYWQEELRGRV